MQEVQQRAIIFGLRAMLLLALIFAPTTALAHSSGGSLDKVVGEYVADMGFSPSALQEGELVTLDFKLWKAESTTTAATFDNVFVRVKQSGTTLFSTTVSKNILGNTVLSFIPPVTGPVLVSARYEQGDEVLVDTSFPLSILPLRKTLADQMPLFAAAAIGLLAGCGLAFLLYKRASLDLGTMGELFSKAREVVQRRKEDRLQKILASLNAKKSITNDEVEKLLQVSDATATRYIEELVQEGKLKQVGHVGKYVRYERT